MALYSLQFVLHTATGSVSFPWSVAAAQDLQRSLQVLLERLKMTAGGPRSPQDPVEFRRQEEGVFVEVFCNPNIWPSPHAAKVLVTLKSTGVRLSTEVELPQVLEDLGQFLEAN